jgi:putative transport protein
VREWVDVLNAIPLVGLMLVVTFGYSLGRVAWREASLGPGAATLLVALALGSLGLSSGSVAELGDARVGIGAFGFALFMYSIGFDAAPHLVSSLRERRGQRFVAVAFVVNGLALVFTLAAAWLLDLEASEAAGLLAGMLTSAPTYAAAAEVAPNATALSVAFAITYPVGLFGVVLLIQIVPRLRGVDLAADSQSDDELEALGHGPTYHSSARCRRPTSVSTWAGSYWGS